MLLDIHGLLIDCEASTPELTAAVVRPFNYFRATEGGRPVRIVIHDAPPPYATLPHAVASFSTPRNVVYQAPGTKIIDYYGRGVVLQEADGWSYTIYSTDRHLLLESFYLLVLSLLGQHCDRHWRLRVHALAVSRGDVAFLFMMPSGTGKSTLALALLEQGVTRYISDDDPLFDRSGRILPFPRPIGILDAGRLREIPEEFVYRIERMEFTPKFMVDAACWADRIETRALDRIVLVTTRRVLNGPTRVEPVSSAVILKALLRDAVLGIGLFQGLEFLVSRSFVELGRKVPVLTKRFLLALQLSRAARGFRLTVSRDQAETARVVREFIESFDAAPP
jgi:hypothetical protein